MSTAANSSSASIHQAQNSPRSGRQSRKSSAAARGSDISPPSPPILGIAYQEQLLVSSPNTGSDSIPAKEANTMVASDGGFCGDDVELDTSDGGGAAKKPAWNMPSSGSTAEVAVVMSGESWPLLSESARAPPRSPSTYSLKPLPHTVSQDLTEVSLSSSKEVISTISAPNTPTRHKSMKRGVGSSTHSIAANDNSSISPTLQQGSAVDNVHNAGKNGADGHKDGVHRGGTYTGHEQQPQRPYRRSPYRRSNSGPITRGDGSQHGNHRRDHGKQDWGNRSFGSRESQGHRVGSRPFMRGPAVPNASFIPPPPTPIRPFVAPTIVYPEMPSPVFYVPGHHPDSLRSVPPMVPIQSMFYPMPDPHLPTKIVYQIDYYFSSENLVKDTFLRQNMDAEGWVSIKLIAGFKKVMQLTDNVQLLLDAIKASNIVEVQGEKVRRKNDWNKWVMSPIHATSPQSMGQTSQAMLSAQFNSIVLDEKAAT